MEHIEARPQGHAPQTVTKHLDWYVQEFSAKHNLRESGTLSQMRDTVARTVGRNLFYRGLITDNGLSSTGWIKCLGEVLPFGKGRGSRSRGLRPLGRASGLTSVSSLPYF